MKPTPRRIFLVVNADNFGLSPSVNAGIRRAHLYGIVTSTTVLMTMPGIEEELKALQEECPRLGLGVQLSLTAGQPLLPVAQRSSLTNGAMDFPDLAYIRQQHSHIELSELLGEWRAQINRFIAVAGKKPEHLVAHEHCAYLSPRLFQAMLELAAETNAAVRVPFSHSPTTRMGNLPFPLTGEMLRLGPNLLHRFALRYTDRFAYLGVEMPALPTLTVLLKRLPPGSTEIFCRPELIEQNPFTGENQPRGQEEYQALIDPQLREIVQKRGIQLVSFNQIEAAPYRRTINTEQPA